jgi:hypothetical protein
MKNNIVKPIGKGLQFVELIEASNNPQDKANLLSQLRAQIGECISNKECAMCGSKVDPSELRRADLLTQREWLISGMCIECQDEMFDDKVVITSKSKKEVN